MIRSEVLVRSRNLLSTLLHPATCLAITIAALSCGTISTPRDPGSRGVEPRPAAPERRFDHVLVVVLENQNYNDAIRDPHLRALAKAGLNLTNFRGLFHPSYPNYLAMVSGRELRTKGDQQLDFDDPTIADLLESKNLTWRNYAQGYPGDCGTAGTDLRYARKHVPFLSFKLGQSHRCSNVVNADTLATDLATGRLPSYAFYSPDLDNDGHDPILNPQRGLAKASGWLQTFLDSLSRFRVIAESTLVVVTFDESRDDAPRVNPFHPELTSAVDAPNHIYTVLWGAMVAPDSSLAAYNHFNVLRTVELNFGLDSLGPGDGGAKRIVEVWKRRVPQ